MALTEPIVFVANRGRCPLTEAAERLGAESGRISDIFLPRRCADRIPQLCAPPLLIGMFALGFRAHHPRRIGAGDTTTSPSPALLPLPHSRT